MQERSLLEGGNPTRQSLDGFSFGRITNVYPETRTCEVKTFMGRGATEDNHIPQCQWLSLDLNPDGDSSGAIPRINSYGIVFYVAGEPFIFGFFSPLTDAGSAFVGEDAEDLNEGDRILKTIAGNKIILRAHGEIQIESTATCRTILFPDQNLINTICRNYEFTTDGGTENWHNINDNNDTLYQKEYRDNISRANVVIEERGTVDGGFLSRTRIGAGTDDGVAEPVVEHTVTADGTTVLFIRAPGAANGYKHTIAPDGTSTLAITDKTTFTILPTGDVTLDVGPGKATLKLTPDGAVSVTCEDKASITAKGGIALTTDGDLEATVKGDVNVTATGDAKVTSSGKVTVKGSSGIDLDGGTGASGGVLVFPNAISDFTGLPIQVASQTVKASI